MNFDECEYRNIILFVLGAIFSVSMPLLTVITYFYFGMKATTIFSLVKFIMVTFILSISYVAIVLMVKRSKNRLESLQENHHLLKKLSALLLEDIYWLFSQLSAATLQKSTVFTTKISQKKMRCLCIHSEVLPR